MFMTDTGVLTLDSLFGDICVLVTAAFALTLVPGLRLRERSLLSMRDRGTALLVFLVLGLIEEASISRSGWLSERIVAVCAAGLVAGPWVGLGVGAVVAWLGGGVLRAPLAVPGLLVFLRGFGGRVHVSVAPQAV